MAELTGIALNDIAAVSHLAQQLRGNFHFGAKLSKLKVSVLNINLR